MVIAYADVDDALIVTMTRILGLYWTYDYERTPTLTPEQVSELTGRSRSTLYRHLKQLRDVDGSTSTRPTGGPSSIPSGPVMAKLLEKETKCMTEVIHARNAFFGQGRAS